jgi:RNA polymerase sigma-70 factor, ECF subfamily
MLNRHDSTDQTLRDAMLVDGDPDLLLVQRAQGGDRSAFDLLTRQYEDQIYRTIFRITRNREDTEDQVQETFLRAYRGLTAFRGHARFSSWLVRIALNQAMQCLRCRKRQMLSLDEAPSYGNEISPEFHAPRPSPESLCIEAERSARIRATLGGLPDTLRSPLILRIYQDKSMQEIASALGLSIAAVKSRILRARERLSNLEQTTVSDSLEQVSASVYGSDRHKSAIV